MWIGLYYQPISMTEVQIDGSRDPELVHIDGKIFEKVTTSLNKKENPCKNYDLDDSDFNSCCKSLFTEFVINSNNCTIPGLTRFDTSKWEITPPKDNFINLYEFGNKHFQMGNNISKGQFYKLV